MVFGRRKQYTGKNVLITGGSEGLGLALATEFLQRKVLTVILVARNLDKLQKARDSLTDLCEDGQKVVIYTADVTVQNEISDVFDKVYKSIGAIDVVVCNAGLSIPGKFLEQGNDVFEKQMQVNYFGVNYTVKACLQDMLDRGSGEIVFISSSAALIGLGGYSSYSPTKAAVRMFSDCLRNELSGSGVSVCIAYPPDMDTPGYAAEEETVTEELQAMMKFAGAEVFKPQQVAQCILKGMEVGRYHLPSPDFLQNLLMISMTGVTPRQFNVLVEMIVSFFLPPVTIFFRSNFDRIIAKFRKNKKTD